MKIRTRITIGLALAGCTVVLIVALRTDAPPSAAPGLTKKPVIAASPVPRPPAAMAKPQPLPAGEDSLLPAPVLPDLTAAELSAPTVANMQLWGYKGRPPEESMMSAWAARDPEAAGHWLNQNRDHPRFADMVRGYAIQIATTDPDAARQWAALLQGNGNRFALGSTLEQHIDAVEAMLKNPAPAPDGQPQTVSLSGMMADYSPRLVRQHPGEPPVLEMQPTSPFV